MKNIIIVVLVVIIGFLAYTQFIKPKNVDTSTIQTVTTSTNQNENVVPKDENATTEKPAVAGEVTVAGMQKYVDSEFGFSFWYPADLKVAKSSTSHWSDKDIENATILSNIMVGDYLNIKVVRSTSRTVTENIQNFGKVTYYFDKNAHLWMKSTTGTFVPANIDDNSMGGLHLFPGIAPYNTVIIPLSANTFVVVGEQQIDNRVPYLARTVVAADPAVGVVQSIEMQTKTVQAFKNVVDTGVRTSTSVLKTFTDPLNGFSFQYPGDLPPTVYATKNGTNISAQGCYIVFEGEGNGTNNKERITLHGVNYCVSEFSDCGMGTCGNEKYYTTYGNGAHVTIKYTTFTHNCSVGDDVATCEQEQSTRLAKELKQIEDSLGTLTFSKQ